MTISYPLSFPTSIGPKSVKFTGMNCVSMSRSPFTYNTQVQEFPGQMWAVDISLPTMQRANAEAWIAFLLSLHGPKGTFYVYDPLSPLPRGNAGGVPRINGANQLGNTLVTDGWTVSVTGIMLAGDKIQIGNRLHMILTDTNSDGSGNATFDIWPRLRESPADDDSIITVSPKGIFRLTDSVTPLWVADETQLYDVGFSALEAI